MKKRILTVLAVILLLAAAWVVNAFMGNPVSALLVRRNAGQYIRSAYPDLDLRIEEDSYSFKDGNYYAFVVSDTSRDTHFTLYYNGLGILTRDTYEDYVSSGWNTARHLDSGYYLQTDPAIKALPYDVTIGYCRMNCLHPDEAPTALPALRQSELILDREYDISALGSEYGKLTLYITTEDHSPEAAARLLLDLNHRLSDIPFYALDLTLQKADSEEELYLRNFLRSEITPEGLEEKIRTGHQNAAEEYAQMDKEFPADVTFRAVFREDGTAELTCGDESLTLSMDALPAESRELGAARLEAVSAGAVRAVFGGTAVLLLEEGAESPDVTADVVWGHVTQSYGANFAVFPAEPEEALRKTLEEQGMSVLVPSAESTVNLLSDGKEVLVSWTAHAAFPAMSAPG